MAPAKSVAEPDTLVAAATLTPSKVRGIDCMTAPGSYQTQTSDMFAVHQAITTALEAAPVLVGGTADNADRVDLIASFYENLLEFLHVHHAGEDELIYPILEERCAHERAMLARIDAQHTLLDEPMSQARAAIAAWQLAPTPAGAEDVLCLLTAIDETLRPHLGEEETFVLPVASAWMSPEEWGEIPGHAMQLFQGDKPWLAIGLIREQLTDEHNAAMLAAMPSPVQTLWTDQWEPAFSAFIGDVRSA
jgi:hemerythrin-like domain-containing protein